MKLDLRSGSRLAESHRDALNEIASAIRKPFVELAGRLGASHADEIEWWVTPLATRNIFACNLFFRCCQLVLAVRVAEALDEGASEIVVETPGLAKTLRRALAARRPAVRVRSRNSARLFALKVVAGMGYRLGAALFHAANRLLCTRIFPPRRAIPARPLTLVDTFLYRHSFEGEYRDRHFPGLLEWLSEDERRDVYFFPSFYKIRNYPKLYRALRASPLNFLVKDDYLRPADYAHALRQPFRSLSYRVRTCEFEGLDIAPLVNEALYETFATSGSIEGMLQWQGAQRMRKAGVQVRTLIDWFENQEIDHGSNGGFRRFFPDASITGYQGFAVLRHYLPIFPTREEMRRELIPHRVAVTGPAFVPGPREWCPELAVCVAPALRFAHVWNDEHESRADPRFTIVVGLPHMEYEGDDILGIVAEVAESERPRGWRFLVKRHPALPPRALESREGAAGLVQVFEPIDRLLSQADVLVSSASSVCIDALTRGTPVIVMGNNSGLTFNPIPDSADPELWALCHTADEVREALRRFASRDPATIERHRLLARNLRDALFARPSRESVVALLGL